MIKEVFSAEETEKIGFDTGKNAKKGDIYCLSGDLGVGKTVFTKGFAKGLGIEEHITSPTFTIVNEYENGGNKFYHFDVYRINDIEEMYDIGYEEYFYGEGICLIEWAEMIEELIPENAVWIEIKKDIEKGLDYRIIEVKK
ncbi:MAG: tRNA (adenosine(37)-N6)-threonylcarbamoyltransferase complex ATPase subunit type 1 TsaE [Firmicutes bacterium]|nr:tRNA (adenosine(37)-N6)-threonylcarbamoyltransferase complex ATPase subunit type 1 TsaE [Bacillota bacterium]